MTTGVFRAMAGSHSEFTAGELLGNGDFQHGNDRWFFTSDRHHLPWHAKNLWLHVYFEQGVLGLLIFSALLVFALLLGAGQFRTAASPPARLFITERSRTQVLALDPATGALRCCPKATDILGFSGSHPRMLRDVLLRLHAADRRRLLRAGLASVKRRSMFDIVVLIRMPDGVRLLRVIGGAGSEIERVLAERGLNVPVLRLGLPDR